MKETSKEKDLTQEMHNNFEDLQKKTTTIIIWNMHVSFVGLQWLFGT